MINHQTFRLVTQEAGLVFRWILEQTFEEHLGLRICFNL